MSPPWDGQAYLRTDGPGSGSALELGQNRLGMDGPTSGWISPPRDEETPSGRTGPAQEVPSNVDEPASGRTGPPQEQPSNLATLKLKFTV